MTYSALSHQSFARPVIAVKPLSIDATAINKAILLMLVLFLGLLYLTSVTKTDALGYRVYGYEQQAAALKAENDDLTLASARLQSLDRVQNSDVASAMVPIIPQ